MNLQQLQYVIALAEHKQFAAAAEKCFVTQPTLSMMIAKLEEELGIKIFQRNKQPIEPTKEGLEIIERAKAIVAGVEQLVTFTQEIKDEIAGEIKIVIIPTLAPYLLPRFINTFSKKYPRLKVNIKELMTDYIITELKNGTSDIGILATPLNDPQLNEIPIFYEEFLVYASESEKVSKRKYVMSKDIDVRNLWILEEGHCFRNQVINLCELKKKEGEKATINYEAGSIETLKNLVDSQNGITILPELACQNFGMKEKRKLKEFASEKPVREISIVTNKNFARKKIVAALKEEIEKNLPHSILKKEKKKIISF